MRKGEYTKIMGEKIYVKCKHCGTEFNQNLDLSERQIKCPVCGEKVE